jgi:hypothetical protein
MDKRKRRRATVDTLRRAVRKDDFREHMASGHLRLPTDERFEAKTLARSGRVGETTHTSASPLCSLQYHSCPKRLLKPNDPHDLQPGWHAVMFKQPDWRFIHMGRVEILYGESNWFVAHLPLRSRIAPILGLMVFTAS